MWILQQHKIYNFQVARSSYLCKHFFAVIDSGYREIEDLTSLSGNHSLHTINTDLFKSEIDDTPLVKKNLLFQHLSFALL